MKMCFLGKATKIFLRFSKSKRSDKQEAGSAGYLTIKICRGRWAPTWKIFLLKLTLRRPSSPSTCSRCTQQDRRRDRSRHWLRNRPAGRPRRADPADSPSGRSGTWFCPHAPKNMNKEYYIVHYTNMNKEYLGENMKRVVTVHCTNMNW